MSHPRDILILKILWYFFFWIFLISVWKTILWARNDGEHPYDRTVWIHRWGTLMLFSLTDVIILGCAILLIRPR